MKPIKIQLVGEVLCKPIKTKTPQSPIVKAYWHLMTSIARYMTNEKQVKFTKNELDILFKNLFEIDSIRTLTEEQWGEYMAFIITKSLTVLDVPSSVVMPTDLKGVQWLE
jgi:hypothetical protein